MVGILVSGGILGPLSIGLLPSELVRSSLGARGDLVCSKLSLTGGTGGSLLSRRSRLPENRPLILSKT
jgi:hypothetical protein